LKKITLIGAGSSAFARQLLSALFSYDSVKDCLFFLHDLDEKRLNFTYDFTKKLILQEKTKAQVERSLDLNESLKNSDFVITCLAKGGLEAWEYDINIPASFNIAQEAGDTMGIGAIFRAARDLPVLLNIAKKMQYLCPKAILLNYSNPLAPIIKALSENSSTKVYGLCYGVHYTLAQILGFLGLGTWIYHPSENQKRHDIVNSKLKSELKYDFAGINHMTWITKLELNGKDLYPDLRALVNDKKAKEEDFIRLEILKYFDYFSTINHWHMSDLVPYFKKNPKLTKHFLPKRWNLLELEKQKLKEMTSVIQAEISGDKKIEVKRNIFNAPKIINAIINNEKTRVNVNVLNKNFVPNLPQNSCVEIPALVDKNGIAPSTCEPLPLQCASLNKTNIIFQEMLCEGVLKKDLSLLKQALYFDPLSSAICTLDDLSTLFDMMHEKQKKFLEF